MEIDVEEPDADGAGGAAGDNEEPEAPNARRRFLPSSIGLTVLLDPDVTEIEARISWGDYRTEPRLHLAAPHQRFIAGRSMRDVEPNVALKVRDPNGNTIANADDLV